MRINLTPTRRAALQAARKALASRLREFREDDTMVDQLRSLAGTLPEEIASMESKMDPSNEDGLLALATKQTKLKSVLRKLEDADSVDEDRHREMRAALVPAADLIREHLAPVVVNVEREIATYLGVVFEEGRAAAEARSSRQVQILAGFANCNFAQFADLRLAAREGLRVIDILLSGRLSFITMPGDLVPRPKPQKS